MEEEKEKDSSNSAAERRAARTHDFFNIIMVILVACFAVILGLHYINRTTIESQQESKADITERFFSAQELPSVMEQASHSISGNTLENKHVSSKTTGSTKTTLVRLTSLTKGTAGDEVADWTGNTEDEERDSLTDSNLPVTVEKQESLDYTSIERDKKNVSSGSKTILSHLTEKTKETKEESFIDKSLLDGSTSIEIDKKNVSSASGTISSNSTEETKEMKESFIDKSSLQDGSTSTLIKLDTSINVTTPEEDFIEKQTKEDSDNDFKILPRRDGVKVGHVQKLELEPGKFYNLKTRSIRPPIFEIPDFLTEYECQQLIYLATQLGLDTSLHQQLDTNYKPTNHETFKEWDHNDDHVVSPQEVIHNMQDTTYLFYSQADIEKMFTELDIDQNRNGVMDLDEFFRVTNDRIMDYLQKLLTIHPRILHRNSRQTWLHYNNVNSLNQRVSALTKIPVNVIERSEKLQVVNYGPEGHYYCHVDSENIDKDLPCCRYYNIHNKCRACRYITVLYFLNDVEEGGETAFPVADNATFSIEEWADSIKYKCDLSKYCHEANVYVKPRKGTALMWYNHLRDDQTGWMGELDLKSYHGGCDVIKGHKWIANSWINIIGDSLDTLETYHPKSEPIP